MLIQPFTQYPGSRSPRPAKPGGRCATAGSFPTAARSCCIVRASRSRSTTSPRDRSAAHERQHRPHDRALHAISSARRTGRNAIAFVVLAISGIVMAFGKFFLLPVIGRHAVRLADLCAEDAAQLRRAAVRGLAVIMFITFLREQPADARRPQVAAAARGGMLGGEQPPSGRFNAGEKIVFWGGVFLLGIVRHRLGLGARQDRSRARSDAAGHAGRAHGPRRRGDVDDRDVHRPHLHGHDRHAAAPTRR